MSRKFWRNWGRFAELGLVAFSQSPLSMRLHPKNANENVTGSSWIADVKRVKRDNKPIIRTSKDYGIGNVMGGLRHHVRFPLDHTAS